MVKDHVLAEQTREAFGVAFWRNEPESPFWRNEPEGSKVSFWPNEPETCGRLPGPSVSNYDACQWIAGDVISAFLENNLVREKSYVW